MSANASPWPEHKRREVYRILRRWVEEDRRLLEDAKARAKAQHPSTKRGKR